MIHKIRIFFIEILANTIGRLLVLLLPKKVQLLSEKGITLVLNDLNLTERLMRRAILKNIEKSQDYDTLSDLHKNYWTNKGADFF